LYVDALSFFAGDFIPFMAGIAPFVGMGLYNPVTKGIFADEKSK
jgi:hypothetical protein